MTQEQEMTRQYFTSDNTADYSAADLVTLNQHVDVILNLWGSHPGSPTYEDDVKNACDVAHNAFPNAPSVE